MMSKFFLLAAALFSLTSQAFIPASSRSRHQLFPLSSTSAATDYDTVKVDLSDGRDYPIYIGAGFSDEEASKLLQSHVKGTKVLLITNDRISPLYLENMRHYFDMAGR
ncbi:3-dehydroquinate synthase [Fragilaria crotonensis]|nr:3-dehydroquinate synthase [Fragilaria crotonensis]